MGQVKLPYGLRGERLLHISEVESGLKCDCVCPSCKEPLIAKIGGGKITSHFAHHKPCSHALESMLHLLAKEIIEEASEIYLPPYSIKHDGKWCTLCCAKKVTVDSVILENRTGNFVPDVVVTMQGRELLVEIAVTHFVDEEKYQKIVNHGVSTIEIDLSSLYGEEFERSKVKKAVVDTWSHKKWLYSSRRKKLLHSYLIKQQKLEEERARERERLEAFYQKNLKRIVLLGDKSREHAEDCPLKRDDPSSGGYSSIWECQDCEYYRGDRDCMSTIVCLGDYFSSKQKVN